MGPLCYRRHRFPPEIIQHAIWLYLRFTLSYRDVEELLAERGLDISYETVRRWVLKFGPAIARRLRQRRPRPSDHWHLDECAANARPAMGVRSCIEDEGRPLEAGRQGQASAEQWEPDDARVSRPVLRERGDATAPRHSPGGPDRRQADVSLAGGRSRGRGA